MQVTIITPSDYPKQLLPLAKQLQNKIQEGIEKNSFSKQRVDEIVSINTKLSKLRKPIDTFFLLLDPEMAALYESFDLPYKVEEGPHLYAVDNSTVSNRQFVSVEEEMIFLNTRLEDGERLFFGEDLDCTREEFINASPLTRASYISGAYKAI